MVISLSEIGEISSLVCALEAHTIIQHFALKIFYRDAFSILPLLVSSRYISSLYVLRPAFWHFLIPSHYSSHNIFQSILNTVSQKRQGCESSQESMRRLKDVA